MRKIKYVLLIIASVFLLSSCGGNSKKGGSSALLPGITGAAFDVLVVGDERMWRDTVGRALFDLLNTDMPCFPQSEPMFNISFIRERDFSGILRPVRNIVFFELSDIYTQGKVTYFKDKWSSPQALVKLTAPDRESFLQLLQDKGEEIITYLVDAERKRTLSFFSKYCSPEMAQKVQSAVNVKMKVPNQMDRCRVEKDFIWMTDGNLNMTQNIVVYSYPYYDKSDFQLEKLLHKRDSVMKLYIAGPAEGSYMATEYRCEPTYKELIDENDRYLVEVRGMWRVEGDIMGGPFVSRSYLDAALSRIVTVEAYLYGPFKKKRNTMRQLETMIRTLELD